MAKQDDSFSRWLHFKSRETQTSQNNVKAMHAVARAAAADTAESWQAQEELNTMQG